MTDIKITAGVKSDGSEALLKAIADALGKLSSAQAKSAGITIKQTTEAEKLAAAHRRSEAAIRAAARSQAAQAVAQRELAAATSAAAKAQQQATQAAIADARGQVKAAGDLARALNTQTQAQIAAARVEAQTEAARTRAMNTQTQARVSAARGAAAAQAQANRTQLAATRAITRALQDQNAAQLAASRAAQQAATNSANASRQASAAAIAAANATAARVNATTRTTVASTNAAARVTAAQVRAQAQVQAAQIRATALASQAANQQRAQAGSVDLLIGRLRNLWVALQGAKAFVGFVRAGTAFNSTLEGATLGIASLITAQATLQNSQGRTLEGAEALTRSMDLAEKQMTKLRIAGIQTAATTEQLVTAFQQGVGPGLAAGLNLEEIRKITIGITQAASAIDLPMHQLNEEVRSLLAGTITYNTRIARTLGITNAMVRDWKAQGVFAERLLERFNAFNVAGERAMGNMAVIKSGLQEAFSVFAGEATKPFFDALKIGGREVLQGLFDFDKGQINAQFRGIVDIARDVFGSMGNLLLTAIRKALAGAEALSSYFDQNRAAIDGVITSAAELVRQVGRVLAGVIQTVAALVDAGIRSGFIATIFKTLGQLTRIVADNVVIIRDVLIGVAIYKGLALLLSFATVANPVVAGIVAIGAALGVLVLATNAQEAAQERLNRQQQLALEKQRDHAVSVHALATEYDVLARRLAAGQIPAAQVAGTTRRLAEIQAELVRLSPEFRREIDAQGKGYKATAAEARKLADAQILVLKTQGDAQVAARAALLTERQQAAAKLETATAAATAAAMDGRVNELSVLARVRAVNAARKSLEEIDARLVAQNEAANLIFKAVQEAEKTKQSLNDPVTITPRGTGEDPDAKAKKASNDYKQIVEAELKRVKETLDRAEGELEESLKSRTISFRDYAVGIAAAQVEALNKEEALRRNLLLHTTDKGERQALESELSTFEQRRIDIVRAANAKLFDLERGLQDEIDQIRTQSIAAEGRAGEAKRRELERQYAELRRTVAAQGIPTTFIDQFIDVEVARARMGELTALIGNARAELDSRLTQVDNLREQGMLTALEQGQQTGDAYGIVIARITAALPEMREFARLSGNPEAIQQVRELENELARLRLEQRRVSDEWYRIGEAARTGLEGGIRETLAGLGDQFDTFEKAWINLALSITRSIQEEVAGQLAQTLTTEIIRAFTAAGNSAAVNFVQSLVRGVARMLDGAMEAVFGSLYTRLGEGLAAAIGRTKATVDPSGIADAAAGAGTAAVTAASEAATATAMNTAAVGLNTSALTLNTSGVTLGSSGVALTGAATSLYGAAIALTAAAGAQGGQSAINLFAAAGKAFMGRFATGGPVPRVGVADPVVAHVEQDEYIHTVAAHRHYGTRIMDALNTRQIPKALLASALSGTRTAMPSRPTGARYAKGGPVTQVLAGLTPGGTASARVTGGIDMTLGLEPGVVVNGLKSRAGESAQIEFVRRNATTIRAMLGIR